MSKFALQTLSIMCIATGIIWMSEKLAIDGFFVIAIAAVFAILSIGGK